MSTHGFNHPRNSTCCDHTQTQGPVCDNPKCRLHSTQIKPRNAPYLSLPGPGPTTIRVHRHVIRKPGDSTDYYVCDECALANVTLKSE